MDPSILISVYSTFLFSLLSFLKDLSDVDWKWQSNLFFSLIPVILTFQSFFIFLLPFYRSNLNKLKYHKVILTKLILGPFSVDYQFRSCLYGNSPFCNMVSELETEHNGGEILYLDRKTVYNVDGFSDFNDIKISDIEIKFENQKISLRKGLVSESFAISDFAIKNLKFIILFWSNNPSKGVYENMNFYEIGDYRVYHCLSFKKLVEMLNEGYKPVIENIGEIRCRVEGSEANNTIFDALFEKLFGEVNLETIYKILEKHSIAKDCEFAMNFLNQLALRNCARTIVDNLKRFNFGNRKIKKLCFDISYFLSLINYGEITYLDKSLKLSNGMTEICKTHLKLINETVKPSFKEVSDNVKVKNRVNAIKKKGIFEEGVNILSKQKDFKVKRNEIWDFKKENLKKVSQTFKQVLISDVNSKLNIFKGKNDKDFDKKVENDLIYKFCYINYKQRKINCKNEGKDYKSYEGNLFKRKNRKGENSKRNSKSKSFYKDLLAFNPVVFNSEKSRRIRDKLASSKESSVFSTNFFDVLILDGFEIEPEVCTSLSDDNRNKLEDFKLKSQRNPFLNSLKINKEKALLKNKLKKEEEKRKKEEEIEKFEKERIELLRIKEEEERLYEKSLLENVSEKGLMIWANKEENLEEEEMEEMLSKRLKKLSYKDAIRELNTLICITMRKENKVKHNYFKNRMKILKKNKIF